MGLAVPTLDSTERATSIATGSPTGHAASGHKTLQVLSSLPGFGSRFYGTYLSELIVKSVQWDRTSLSSS